MARFGLAMGGGWAYVAGLAGRSCAVMPASTSSPRRVRLLRNNRGQAVRIPVEFELPDTEALIYRKGTRLIVEPVRWAGLAALLASWTRLDEDFPNLDYLPRSPRDIF